MSNALHKARKIKVSVAEQNKMIDDALSQMMMTMVPASVKTFSDLMDREGNDIEVMCAELRAITRRHIGGIEGKLVKAEELDAIINKYSDGRDRIVDFINHLMGVMAYLQYDHDALVKYQEEMRYRYGFDGVKLK